MIQSRIRIQDPGLKLFGNASTDPQYMYSMTPKIFSFFFNIICQKILQVSSIEEDKLQFCTLLLPVSFLLANFFHFSQQFQNQRKILSCFVTHIQIL
jgi:hypothetical protein